MGKAAKDLATTWTAPKMKAAKDLATTWTAPKINDRKLASTDCTYQCTPIKRGLQHRSARLSERTPKQTVCSTTIIIPIQPPTTDSVPTSEYLYQRDTQADCLLC